VIGEYGQLDATDLAGLIGRGEVTAGEVLETAHAALLARDVDIVGARFLQRQPHILAAALDLAPVVEFVLHCAAPRRQLRI